MNFFSTIAMYPFKWYLFLALTPICREVVNGAVIDLGHVYWNNVTTCWNPKQSFSVFNVTSAPGPNGPFVIESFSTSEHCGTHLDAPYHFNPTGWKVEEIPLHRMLVEGVHINISHEVNGNPDFVLTADHLDSWVLKNGPLPFRSVIIVNFGWAHMYGDRQSYYGSLEEPYRFPGLSKDAAQWIVDSGVVYGVGVDGPSVDPGSTKTFDAHGVLSKANLFNLENVALNGTRLPPRGFKLVLQPIKIGGGTGGPVRIFALTPLPFLETN